jgi:predicted ATPase
MSIASLRLHRYKGFREYRLRLRDNSILVGPNNAGKSTIIAALRLCATLIAQAKRKKAEIGEYDESRGRHIRAYQLRIPAGQFVDENVHHEFRAEEARLELHFKNKSALYVVWPADREPYFYVEHIEGMQPTTVRQTKEWYPSIGVVSTLTPIEHQEKVLSPEHIRENYTTRLASRHFRNQLFLLESENKEAFEKLVAFLLGNTPEAEELSLALTTTNGPREIDLFFKESSTRTEKELFWVGDGLQIWMQVIFHIWRQRDVDVLVLDEPDVFLHPDLQRRLVRVLEEARSQIILATHAPEVLSEASKESVVIVDRSRSTSRKVADERVLAELNDALGSGFNLRLARALRSRVALFVEGNDMAVLRNLANKVGAENFAKERGLTVIPMSGFSNRRLASAFGWLNKHVLDDAVKVAVFLDRDYLSDAQVAIVLGEYEPAGVLARVWARKELESYLLSPNAIARISGATVDLVNNYIDEAIESMYYSVFARFNDERSRTERSGQMHQVSLTEKHGEEFAKLWVDRDWRRRMCPPKDVISEVNRKLQDSGKTAVSVRSLSRELRAHEIPGEMRDALLDIESMLQSGILL